MFGMLVLAFFCTFPLSECQACGTFGARPVAIASESAIIVWNKSTQTEHFVRTVTFDTSDSDFGFVVPTPTVPKLASVDDAAIPLLNDTIQPTLTGEVTNILPVSLWTVLLGSTARNKLSYVGSTESGVEVVAEQHVNGIDATTLDASNIASLKRWMEGNGYPWSSDISDWLQPYVVNDWKITIFKFVKVNSADSKLASSLLDLTFQTTKPFYPYTEPAYQRDPDSYDQERLLRVFMLSDARMDAGLGQNSFGADWPGRTISAAPVDSKKLHSLSTALKLLDSDLPEGTWLTAFDDKSSPRPGYADLYFWPSETQDKIVLPVIDKRIKHHFYIPIDLLAIFILFAGSTWLSKLRQTGKVLPQQFELYNSLFVIGLFVAYLVAVYFGALYYRANL